MGYSALADTLGEGICISTQGKKSLTHTTAAVANGMKSIMSAVFISVCLNFK